MNEHQICKYCPSRTKKAHGFWDGVDRRGRWVGGALYSCRSRVCPIARRRKAEEAGMASRREAAEAANRDAGIDAEQMCQLRRLAGLTLKEAGDLAGISSLELSCYERQNLPTPPEVYHRLMAELEERCGYEAHL